jgi:hypothetical protein
MIKREMKTLLALVTLVLTTSATAEVSCVKSYEKSFDDRDLTFRLRYVAEKNCQNEMPKYVECNQVRTNFYDLDNPGCFIPQKETRVFDLAPNVKVLQTVFYELDKRDDCLGASTNTFICEKASFMVEMNYGDSLSRDVASE